MPTSRPVDPNPLPPAMNPSNPLLLLLSQCKDCTFAAPMERTAFLFVLGTLLLLPATSVSAQQQSPPGGADSTVPESKTTNRGAAPGDSGSPTSKGASESSKPASKGPVLSASPPPPSAGNSSPPPPVPPPSGSRPPPPIGTSIRGGPLVPRVGGGEEKGGGGDGVLLATVEEVRRCIEKGAKCGDSLVFCLLILQKDPKKQLLLVHNVCIQNLTLRANETKEIPDVVPNSEVVINVGKTRCPLFVAPPPPPLKLIQQFLAYATPVTPVYAAYAILLVTLVTGSTWACCRSLKRARQVDSGLPYRQLEMGMQAWPSYTPDTSNTVEGWDQGWDDEEAATGPLHGMTTSSIGTAATKSSAKDGWEDWDD